MIDKFIYKCCDVLDRYSDWVNSIFMPKPRKKHYECVKAGYVDGLKLVETMGESIIERQKTFCSF